MDEPILKGKRTYLALALTAVLNLAGLVTGAEIDPEVRAALSTLLLAAAAYFRTKA